jgi:hypothetical protein
MPTIIDSLVVTLGLDPRNFKKGTDEAKKQTKETRDTVKSSSEDITKSFGNVARSVAGMVLGFEGLKGAINFMVGLVDKSADLALMGRSFGAPVHDIDAAGNAIAAMGGKAQDAYAAFGQFSREFANLTLHREIGPLLRVLQLADVNPRDAQGKARDFKAVLADLNKAVNQRFNTVAEREAFLADSGLAGGMVTELALETEAYKRLNVEAERSAKITADQAAAALKARTEVKGLQNQVSGDLVGTADAVAPHAVNFIKDLLNSQANLFGTFIELAHGNFKEAGKAYAGAFGFGSGADQPFSKTTESGDLLSGSVRNNNPGNLRDYPGGNHEVDSRGIRKFGTLKEGVEALREQIHKDADIRGLTLAELVHKYAPASDGNNESAYVADLMKKTGIDGYAKASKADRELLLQGIIGHEGAAKPGQAGSILTAYPGALDAARGATPTPAIAGRAGGTNTDNSRAATNTTHVGSVTINTQATDADSIADEFTAALHRTQQSSQADIGQIP